MQVSLNTARHLGKALLESLPNVETYALCTLGRPSAFRRVDGLSVVIERFESDAG